MKPANAQLLKHGDKRPTLVNKRSDRGSVILVSLKMTNTVNMIHLLKIDSDNISQ